MSIQISYLAILIATLFISLSSSQQGESITAEAMKLTCYAYSDLTFFDLTGLQDDERDYMYRMTAYNESSDPIFEDLFVFNFCKFTTNSCRQGEHAWAYKVHSDLALNSTTCSQLSGGSVLSSLSYQTVVDEKAHQRHVKLTYKNGDICPYSALENTQYQISVELKCKANSNDEQLPAPVINATDRCHPVFTYETKHGCPTFSATAWVRFVRNHPWILAIILIVFGILSTFRGKEFFEITVGILGGGVVFLVSMLFFSYMEWLEYLDDFESEEAVIAISAFLLAAVIAFIVGYILAKAGWLIGVMTLGVIAGFFLGVSIYNLVFFATNALWLFIALSVGGALLGGYLAYTYHDQIMIFGTSFIGAYSFIRGVSLFGGNFPNEALLYQQIQQGITPEVTWDFFAYLVGIVVLFVFGSIYQIQHNRKLKEGLLLHYD